MFTVTVGRDASGKSSTRAPLASLYSVTPSIEATLTRLRHRGRPSHENPAEHEQLTHGEFPPKLLVVFGIIVVDNADR